MCFLLDLARPCVLVSIQQWLKSIESPLVHHEGLSSRARLLSVLVCQAEVSARRGYFCIRGCPGSYSFRPDLCNQLALYSHLDCVQYLPLIFLHPSSLAATPSESLSEPYIISTFFSPLPKVLKSSSTVTHTFPHHGRCQEISRPVRRIHWHLDVWSDFPFGRLWSCKLLITGTSFDPSTDPFVLCRKKKSRIQGS